MRVAVGIIGLVLSMIVLLQSCTVTGLSNLGGQRAMAEAGSLGVLTAALMFFGGAFAFGMPGVARVLFVLGFLASIPARKEFPDMWVWGIASAILAGLLLFAKAERRAESALTSPLPEPPRWDPTPAQAVPPPLPATAAAPLAPLAPAAAPPPLRSLSPTPAAPGSGDPAPSYDVRKWEVLKEVDEEIAAAAGRVAAFGAGFEAELAEKYLTLNDRAYLAQIERRITERVQSERGRVAELATTVGVVNAESSLREMETYANILQANGDKDPAYNMRVTSVEPYTGSWPLGQGGIEITLENGWVIIDKDGFRRRFTSKADVF